MRPFEILLFLTIDDTKEHCALVELDINFMKLKEPHKPHDFFQYLNIDDRYLGVFIPVVKAQQEPLKLVMLFLISGTD